MFLCLNYILNVDFGWTTSQPTGTGKVEEQIILPDVLITNRVCVLPCGTRWPSCQRCNFYQSTAVSAVDTLTSELLTGEDSGRVVQVPSLACGIKTKACIVNQIFTASAICTIISAKSSIAGSMSALIIRAQQSAVTPNPVMGGLSTEKGETLAQR